MKAETFTKALGEISDSYIEEAIRYKKTSAKGRLAKRCALAACLALLFAACGLLMSFRPGTTVTAYAHGTDEEITAAGAVLTTGTISDSGKMKGKPLMFYLSGEGIATVRFSCKNQQISFMDWTEKREEYGNAGNFTVTYGQDASEYYYLTVDWTPDTIIRELTDNPSSTVAGLPEDMRRDIIVLEITFADGKTATKAIRVSLLDDGTFFASFEDYEISPSDAFVQRPDAPAIPREILYAQGSEGVSSSADAPPMVFVNNVLYRQSPQQICYDEKKAGFLYLGKILSDVTGQQRSADAPEQNAAEGAAQDAAGSAGQNTVGNASQIAADSAAQDAADGMAQLAADGIPKENFQANTPIVGAEVYQYNSDIVVLVNGKYWLYEPIAAEGSSVLEKYIPEGAAGVSSDTGDLSEAEEAAKAYYAGTVFEVVSLEPESQEDDMIVFSVTVKKGGVIQEPERKIFLLRNQGIWEVTNEGY